MAPIRSIIGGIYNNLYGNSKVRNHPRVSTSIPIPGLAISKPARLVDNATTSTGQKFTGNCNPCHITYTTTLFPVSLYPDSWFPNLDSDAIIKTMKDGFAKGTINNYESAIQSFNKFCDSKNIGQNHRLPASEVLLCAFASSLSNTVAGTTANSAITALKRWHNLHNLPWQGSERLSLIVCGIGNNAPATSRHQKRVAVTPEMLHALTDSLDPESPMHAAILACPTLAFFGQARLGELLSTSRLKHNPCTHPSRDSVTILFSNNAREVHLPKTKTNQANGQSIIITRQRDPIDPVKALERHFRVNHSMAPNNHIFAYISPTSRIGRHSLTHKDFMRKINEIWTAKGYPRITGHSFRIGGTTTLLRSGVPPKVGRELGRWSSDAFFEYWRVIPTIAKQHVQFLDLPSALYTSSKSHPVCQAYRTGPATNLDADQPRHKGRPTRKPYHPRVPGPPSHEHA